MSDRAKWDEQAKFMREVGATAAFWTPTESGGLELVRLDLAPSRPATPPPAPEPKGPKGIAARLMKHHEIQYAHTRLKPPVRLPNDTTDVPRAVAAKQGASGGSTAKASKRGS